jgi:hypothetical protein
LVKIKLNSIGQNFIIFYWLKFELFMIGSRGCVSDKSDDSDDSDESDKSDGSDKDRLVQHLKWI